MKNTNKKINFLLALIYLMSRVLLLSPDALVKKSKRIVFFQERYSILSRDSRTVVAASLKVNNILSDFKEVKFSSTFFPLLKSDRLQIFPICYRGLRICSSPPGPDDWQQHC